MRVASGARALDPDDEVVGQFVRRHVPQMFGQIELLVVGASQTQRTPAQPDQIVGVAGLADALAQAPQAFGVRIIAVGEPDFSGNGGSAIERFGAVLVRQLEMAEAARAQIVDRVHPPIRAFAAGLADATAVRNPKNPARPSKAATRRLGLQH